jgi:hypothetical protein
MIALGRSATVDPACLLLTQSGPIAFQTAVVTTAERGQSWNRAIRQGRSAASGSEARRLRSKSIRRKRRAKAALSSLVIQASDSGQQPALTRRLGIGRRYSASVVTFR